MEKWQGYNLGKRVCQKWDVKFSAKLGANMTEKMKQLLRIFFFRFTLALGLGFQMVVSIF